MVEWLQAFEAEALSFLEPDEDRARRTIEYRLTAERAGLMLWEDGDVVSVAGFGGETPNGIRIGPVYTPPELRGRGYATALVAELSSKLLAEGRRVLLPLHRSREPDLERDLRAHRLRPRLRVGRDRLRRSLGRDAARRPRERRRHGHVARRA